MHEPVGRVFVALADGPHHPTFPGVGFIVIPALPWRRVGRSTGCFLSVSASAWVGRPVPIVQACTTQVLGAELKVTPDALVIPFGKSASAAVEECMGPGYVSADRCLLGFPTPREETATCTAVRPGRPAPPYGR
ncbi:hypothetical protein [Streptomyces sp. NPDC002990]